MQGTMRLSLFHFSNSARLEKSDWGGVGLYVQVCIESRESLRIFNRRAKTVSTTSACSASLRPPRFPWPQMKILNYRIC